MTRQELIELLQSLGVDTSKFPDDLKTNVNERIILRKFDGDGPPDRTDAPIETIVIENGKIVERG